ncbi:F18O14.15 [Arabidopsis thaliana]|uniref:F18O14.15 n=1 Tax=Arabidopsis thaliana TaxID=3702 RepID=Q9LN55_ARATH|nr:F18O14.15 [Arabidopsis thaliana]
MIIFLGFCSISRIRVGNHHLIDYRGWTWSHLSSTLVDHNHLSSTLVDPTINAR